MNSNTTNVTVQSDGTKNEKKSNVITLDRSKSVRGFKQYLAVFLWVGWTFFYFAFTLSIPLLYQYNKFALSFIVGLILISAFTTVNRKKQPKWGYALGKWIFRRAAEYFKMQVILEDKEAVEKCGPAIFALEPHDILPLSIHGLSGVHCGFKGHNLLGCITSVCFKIPLMKHIYTWVNAVSVDKRNVKKILSEGYSPILCPGGLQEVTLMENNNECVLFLKSRLGFIKIALEFGCPIIPVFSFGLQNSFTHWIPKGKFITKFARKIGFLPVWFSGVFGFPLGPPKPCQYINVVGSPIIIPKTINPTKEDLLKYQSIYIEELTRIYHTYQDQYGMKGISLRIA